MASASRPVGVRLCETCNAAGAIPAPVSASVTCAVAGFGDPPASLPRASVTVFLAASVAAAAAAAGGCPYVSASCPAVPVSGAAALVSDAAGPVPATGSLVDAAPGPVPLAQPERLATSAAAAVAATNRRAVPYRATPGTVAAGSMAPGTTAAESMAAGSTAAGSTAAVLADEAPAVEFCRWSGLSRMVSFCHAAWPPLRNLGGQCTAGGCRRTARQGTVGTVDSGR